MTETLLVAVGCKIKLDYPKKKGVTLRKELEQVERTSGVHDPILDSVEVPIEGEFLWGVFWALTGRLSYTELQAYCQLTNMSLNLWEINTLMLMESTAMKAITEL